MYTTNYQQHLPQDNPFIPFQPENHFMHDPCIMCHHSSRHQSILSTVANALFNYYLFPQAYVYVVSAPILTNKSPTVIDTETSTRKDTAKANASAKMQFSPAHKANNDLKNLIEDINSNLSQFEKSPTIDTAAKSLVREAGFLATQVPRSRDHASIEAFKTAINILQNEFVQLKNQMNDFEVSLVQSRTKAFDIIQNSKEALKTSFSEFEIAYDLHGELKNILNSRQEFWNQQETLAESTYDFTVFNLETEKQIAFDFFLLSFLEDEVTKAKSNKVSIPSHLGMISTITDENFTQKVSSALNKFDMAPLSGVQILELKNAIVDVMLEVEKKEITEFLNHLRSYQEKFSANGFMTIAEHYSETINEFEEIAKKLSLESIGTYMDEWNALLVEISPQHCDLLE
ncbi:MAG TPA: hypothetical protein VGP47_11520, partial [Parachlamydiaceae bacterium]|nr:hypothetical protein [Parachlamydiaceae bacterium]